MDFMETMTPQPDPEPRHEGFNPWPFILLSILVVLSITFDVCKEHVEHATPNVFQVSPANGCKEVFVLLWLTSRRILHLRPERVLDYCSDRWMMMQCHCRT